MPKYRTPNTSTKWLDFMGREVKKHVPIANITFSAHKSEHVANTYIGRLFVADDYLLVIALRPDRLDSIKLALTEWALEYKEYLDAASMD